MGSGSWWEPGSCESGWESERAMEELLFLSVSKSPDLTLRGLAIEPSLMLLTLLPGGRLHILSNMDMMCREQDSECELLGKDAIGERCTWGEMHLGRDALGERCTWGERCLCCLPKVSTNVRL